MRNKIICWLIGHTLNGGALSVGLMQAKCGRCKKTYHASYDMSYGETIFENEV